MALSWFPWDSPLRSFVVGSWLAASFFDHGWWFGLQLQESLPSLFALGCVAVSLLNPPIHFEWIEHRTADWVDKLPSGSVVVELTRAHLADLAESKKAQMDINPVRGVDIHKLLARVFTLPPGSVSPPPHVHEGHHP